MRRGDQCRQAPQRAVGRRRLGAEGIQAGTGDAAFAERFYQGVGVDQLTTGSVDQDGAWAHALELGSANQVVVGLGQRAVQADDIAFSQQAIEILFALDVRALRQLLEVGVEHLDLHAQWRHQVHEDAADRAQTYKPQGFARQLHAVGRGFVPMPVTHARIQQRGLTCHAEHQREGQLGHRLGIGAQGDRYRDAAVGGGLQIDGVVAHAVLGDHFQVG